MPHGAWLGTLERRKLCHFLRHVRTGMTVWDLGANAGLYALASARAVGPSGRVYAFEPMQRNQQFLREHLALNHVTNVLVVPFAVAEIKGTVRMAEGDSPSEFHMDRQGAIEVPSIDLDSWREDNDLAPPDVLKLDVEGAEDAVLRGGARTFSQHRPVIYVALHGQQQREACHALLSAWGYQLAAVERAESLETSWEWIAEPARCLQVSR
jgi:FkbM family methyltransferase